MVKTIYQMNAVKIVEMGYRPPRVKSDELWWNVYQNDKFVKGFHLFNNQNAGDAILFALNISNNQFVQPC
jgi:hypothetical protein